MTNDADNAFINLRDHAVVELDRARSKLAEVGAPAVHRFEIDDRHYEKEGGAWVRLFAELDAAIPRGTVAIYLIRPIESAEIIRPIIRDYFTGSKGKGDGRSRDNGRLSRTLYVGSSRKMRVRLREHLGFCSHTTYALKLLEWYPAAELPLELVCAVYEGANATVVAALEDALWETLQPMYGRKGAR